MRDANNWHPDEHELAAFDAGELSGAPWTAIEDHVSRCAACCRRLEQLPADPLSAMVRDYGNRILEVLGAGGMGVVFKAEHRVMNRIVALAVSERMLAKDPAQRYQTPADVASALDPYVATARAPRRPRRWVGLGAAVVGVAAVRALPPERKPEPHVEAPPPPAAGAQRIDAHQHLTGTVAFRVLAKAAGGFALRMHRVPGKKGTTSYQLLKGGIPAESGTFAVKFGPFDSAGAVKPTTLPVFVELLAVDDPRRPDLGTVVSNTVIALVTVVPRN